MVLKTLFPIDYLKQSCLKLSLGYLQKDLSLSLNLEASL